MMTPLTVHQTMSDDAVVLDVGGCIFKTHKSTLMPCAYFAAILDGPWSETQEKKPIFVDRDPEHFRHVLALLRDPQHEFPQELMYELEFYGITLFKSTVDAPPPQYFATIENDDEESEDIPVLSGEKYREIFGDSDTDASGSVSSGALTQLAAVGPQNQRQGAGSLRCIGDVRPAGEEPPMSSYIQIPVLPAARTTKQKQFTVVRAGDTMTDMILRFKLDPSEWDDGKEPRYEALNKVSLVIGGQLVDEIRGPVIEIMDIVHMSRDQRWARRKIEEASHMVSQRLPFFFCGTRHSKLKPVFTEQSSSPLPMGSLMYHEVRCHVHFNTRQLEDPVLSIEQCMLNTRERTRMMQGNHNLLAWQHYVFEDEIQAGTRIVKALLPFNHPVHRFYWAIRGCESGKFYPVKRVVFSANSHAFLDAHDRVMREKMLLHPECHGNGLEPVYMFDLGDGSINSSRIDNLSIRFEMYEKLPELADVVVIGCVRNYATIANGMFGLNYAN